MRNLLTSFILSVSGLEMASIGGKATNLQKLSEIEGISIPPWIAIPSDSMKEYLETLSPSEDIQTAILQGTLSDDFLFQLSAAMEMFQESSSYAVRSSGLIEDSEQASCAGLYDSFLNCKSFEEIAEAVKATWASSYNSRAPQSEHLMGVIVQECIDSAVSGVATSKVLSNNYNGIQIAANYGMGESIVHGDVDVDGWVVHPTKGYVLEAIMGSKESCYKFSKTGGLEKVAVSQEDQHKFCLSLDEVHQLAEQINKIKSYYGCEVDVEFALDQDRKIYILQTRPLVEVSNDTILTVDPEISKKHRLIARGLYSLPGAVSGRLIFISNWNQLASREKQIGENDIVVAYITTNTWSHYLAHIKGLITREGSPSSHPILLCREKHVPCLIGMTEGFDDLLKLDGQIVTLDGLNRVVYEGEIPLIESKLSEFEVMKMRAWPNLQKDLPHLLHNKMVVESDGKYWRKTPTYPLTGFQLDLNMRRFDLVSEIIGKNVKVLSKAIDGYSCNEMVPYEEYVNLFENFSLEEARDFNQSQSLCCTQFLEDAQNFDFEKFIETYARFRAYIWVGAAFRSYAERKIDMIGIQLELPLYYLEECSKAIQAEIPEADVTMHEEINQLARILENHTLPSKVEELDSILYQEIEAIAQKYRFEHSISLDRPLDLNLVYQRILLEVASKNNSVSNKRPMDRIYFPEYPELVEWLRLSIWNRILQSDSHHLDAQVKLIVRPKFLALGQKLVKLGILDEPNKIFNCTYNELKNFAQLP